MNIDMFKNLVCKLFNKANTLMNNEVGQNINLAKPTNMSTNLFKYCNIWMVFFCNFLLGHVIINCDTPQESLESLLEYQKYKNNNLKQF
jgi:hypothetical protein